MEHYRLYGDNRQLYQMKYERDPYSQKQNFLYKQAVYGISAYSTKQISEMNKKKKSDIINRHRKAQRILNTLKQQRTNEITSCIFKSLFPNSSLAQKISEDCRVDKYHINRLTFKELGINKKDIIDKLIKFDILPKDFMTL